MVDSSADAGPPTTARIEARQLNGHRCIALIGEIDLSNAADIEAALIEVASSGTPVTLDLLALSYLDSQGVAMLFRLADRSRLDGGSLTLVNPRGIVLRVLRITNVGSVATITGDS